MGQKSVSEIVRSNNRKAGSILDRGGMTEGDKSRYGEQGSDQGEMAKVLLSTQDCPTERVPASWWQPGRFYSGIQSRASAAQIFSYNPNSINM